MGVDEWEVRDIADDATDQDVDYQDGDTSTMPGFAARAVGNDVDSVDAQVEQLVRDIVTALVDEPDAVEIASFVDGSSLIIEVKVAENDAGKVIGRQGRIIKALRTLTRAASSYMNGRHIEVEIIDQ